MKSFTYLRQRGATALLLPLLLLLAIGSGIFAGSKLVGSLGNRFKPRSQAKIICSSLHSESMCSQVANCYWQACPDDPSQEGCYSGGDTTAMKPICEGGGRTRSCSTIRSRSQCNNTENCYWLSCPSDRRLEGCKSTGEIPALAPICDDEPDGGTGNRTAECSQIRNRWQCSNTVNCYWQACPEDRSQEGCRSTGDETTGIAPVCDLGDTNDTANVTTTPGSALPDLGCVITQDTPSESIIGSENREFCLFVANFGQGLAQPPIDYQFRIEKEGQTVLSRDGSLSEPLSGQGGDGLTRPQMICGLRLTNPNDGVYRAYGVVDPNNRIRKENVGDNWCEIHFNVGDIQSLRNPE